MVGGSRVIPVFFAWLALCGAASAKDEPAVRPLFLHLEQDALIERPAPAEPLVQLDPAEFKSLTDAWEAAAKARAAAIEAALPKPPPPPPAPRLPASLKSVRLEGAVDGQTLSLAAAFACGPGTAPDAPVTLLPGGWALVDFQGADPRDRVAFTDAKHSSLQYTPAATGAAQVTAQVALPVVSDRSRRSVTMLLPGAADQQLAITIPGPATGVALTPGWLPVVLDERKDGSVRVTAPLGFLTSASVSWMAHGATVTKAPPPSAPPPPPKPATPPGARLFVNVGTLHSIGDGIVRFHSWIDLVNSRDRVGSVTLSLPLKVSVRQVTGPMVKSFEVTPQENRKEVRVVFSEAFRGRTRVELDGEAAIPREGEAPLPLVNVLGAVRVHGVCGVSVFATYRVEPSRIVESTQIDVSELPGEVSAASPSPVLLAFRCGSPKSELSLKLTRFTPHQRLPTAIEGINAVTVMSPAQVTVKEKPEARLRTYTRLVMKVANAGAQDLRFTLPSSAQIESCFVDLVPQVPAKLPAGDKCTTYLIPLKLSSVAGNRLVPYPVEVAYRQDLPRQPKLTEVVELPFPGLSAPATDTSWTVYTPDGQRVVAVGGAFHEVADNADLLLVTHGQTIFEILIYRGGKFVCLLGLLVLVPMGLWRLSRRNPDEPASAMPASSSVVVSMGLAGLIVVTLASVAVPNFKAARERANTRACYANQKTVVGAMEMYNLDKNTKRGRLDATFFHALKSGGYLQSVPQDPGQGPGSSGHYHESNEGNGIACKIHGAIQ